MTEAVFRMIGVVSHMSRRVGVVAV